MEDLFPVLSGAVVKGGDGKHAEDALDGRG